MKPLSSSQLSSSARLRRIVAASVLVAAILATIGFGIWKRYYSPEKRYLDMVNAFYTGAIGLQVGDPHHTLSGLMTATQIDPKEPAAWADLGIYYLRLNNVEEASKDIKKAKDLAPNNSQIAFLSGLIASEQSNYGGAVAAYQEAVQLDPKNLRAHYELEEALGSQSDPDAEMKTLKQFQAIYDVAPGNLFAEFNLALTAAKARNSGLTRHLIAQIATQSATWEPDFKQSLKILQSAAAGPDIRAAIIPMHELQNQVSQTDKYRADALLIRGNPDILGDPLTRFVTLPNPSPTPAPPDTDLKLTPQPLAVSAPGPWAWAQTAILTPHTDPALIVADGKEVRVAGVSLPFPGGPRIMLPTPDSILAQDFNNDMRLDLACAGGGGLRLYQQSAAGTFVDVTGNSKLPPNVINGTYTGVWTAPIYTATNLDLILGTTGGSPMVLRNNGDGTWAVQHPFGAINTGLTQFVWADLSGDGSPDAAYINGQGQLVVLQNKRAGAFTSWAVPSDLGPIAALSAADPDRDGTQDLVVLTSGGLIRHLSRRSDGNGWETADLGHVSAPPSDGSVRLHWADLDNNGALDLIVTSSSGSQVLLGDTQDKLIAFPASADAHTVSVDAKSTHGRLDLIGLTSQGQVVRLVNTGKKDYGWQEIQMQALSDGDLRNNIYGIGGEIGLRAGLLYETQTVTSPVTHFGMGDYEQATFARILWPNGSPQGEFELKANRLEFPPDRGLKGSCPWLFADDGTGMKFITDFIWRSPLGLRINAQDTAGVVQTRDWVKVRGDQLKPRDGFYNLRITADLWETHFFDEVKLMVVDHPVGTEINVDERFSIPPPPLAVNAMTPPQPVTKAVDDRGKDVTDIVRARDGRYLDTFGLGRYQGVTRDHWVTLDLGPKLPSGPLWLVGYGWIHPTDSSINVALGEGHHSQPRDLSLEVPDGKGGWRVAKPHLGFPEGKNKTVLISLTGLFAPGIPHQVRLRTNMEIYWDFLGTAQALSQTQLKTQLLPLSQATLRYRGFSATHQANWSSPELPDYAHLAGTAPRWLDLEGYCTRFGDVLPLLAKTDDRYVIMNAGDEMILRFAALPPPPPGWTRDYVFTGDGWEKDGDFNTAFSRTVLPLPSHSRPAYNTPPGRLQDDPVYKAHKQDWVTYQTRWISPQRFHTALRP
jgi:cytochrome c-type biogenesis protein CcmH/NrfG